MDWRFWVKTLVLCTLGGMVLSLKENVTEGNVTSETEDTDTKPPDAITMTCGNDVIEVSLPLDSVKSNSTGLAVSPDYIMFRPDASQHCRATAHNDGSYRLSLNPKSKLLCGSTVTEEDYQTEYRNEVVLLDADGGDIRSLFNVTCVYQDDERVILLPPSSSKLHMPDFNGAEVSVQMNLYRDKSYSEDSAIRTETPEISVGHFLFVSMDLMPIGDDVSESKHIHIISNNCFASYFASARIKRMYHQFIADGCADKVDSTVAIQSNGVGWKSRWKFQMFKWVNTTAQRIYLFCEIRICDDRLLADTEFCDMNKTKANCFGRSYSRRTRREVLANAESDGDLVQDNILSFGPIFPKESVYLLDIPKGDRGDKNMEDSGSASEEPTAVVPAAVGVVLGVCVIVIAVAAYLIWKRHVAQRIARRERSKKEIKPGFAFAIKSSNDQNIFNATRGRGEEDDGLDLEMPASNQRSTEVARTRETVDKSKVAKRQRRQKRRHSSAKTNRHEQQEAPNLESRQRRPRSTSRTARRTESERGRKSTRESRCSRDKRSRDASRASPETQKSKSSSCRPRSSSRTSYQFPQSERGRKVSRERRHSKDEGMDCDRKGHTPHRSRSLSRTATRRSESERGRNSSRGRRHSRDEEREHRSRSTSRTSRRYPESERGRSSSSKREHYLRDKEEDRASSETPNAESAPHRSRNSSRSRSRRRSECERGRSASRERTHSRDEKEGSGGRSRRQRVSRSSEPRHRDSSRDRSSYHMSEERSKSSHRKRHSSTHRRETSSD